MTYQTELTGVSKRAFRDFSLDLRPNPKTGDILLKSTSESIKQAIKILMLSNFYERPFRPWLGSNVTASLFEMPTPDQAFLSKREIIRLIETHEPRVTDVSVDVTILDDSQTLRCKVGYLEIGSTISTELEVFLNRER